jgi:FHA domain-containing protein
MSQLEAARTPRPPVPPRTRRVRITAVTAACGYLLLLLATRSVVLSLIMVLLLAVAGVIAFLAVRSWGFTASHPWVRNLVSRPWRTGQEVWQLALKHLPETFIIAPDGSRLAPDRVELRMNPEDYADLTGSIDVEVLAASSSDVYRSLIAEHGARYAGTEGVSVTLIDDPDVAPGRYRLRPRAVSALVPAGARIPVPAGSSFSWAEANGQTAGHTVASEHDTMTSRPDVPCLRLLTRDAVTETRQPGALAGRGTAAELKLPDDLTVSRVHAEFSYADGHWQVANRGRNGLRLNGKTVSGQQAVADGDLIHWGHQADALTSLVQIGPQP